MARPQKTGLEYFPLDVDFFDDDKICVIRKEYGIKGELAAVKLLCAVYRNGYFTEWNDRIRIKLYSALPSVSEECLEQIVRSLVKWGFFDKGLFDSAGILTSHGIQVRYFSATKRRVKACADLPYILPDVFPEKTKVDSETEFLHTETPLMSAESTINKSKVNDNNSLRSSLSLSSSSSTAATRVREGNGRKEFLHTETPLMSAENVHVQDVMQKLADDRDWLLSMQRRFGLDANSLRGWSSAFVNDCMCRGSETHQDKSDVMRHFNDWLSYKLKPVRSKGTAAGHNPLPQPTDYVHAWLCAHAELCQTVSADESAATFDLMAFEGFDAAADGGGGILTLVIPSHEVYRQLELPENTRRILSVLSRYFGAFTLQYRIREPGLSGKKGDA